jgi:hypothetical protein
MGLHIHIGLLAFFVEQEDPEAADNLREEIDLVNEVLIANNLPVHMEPENLSIQGCTSWGFSYSWIYYLRRFYARVINDPNWVPTVTPENEDPADDEVLEEELYIFDSHLICHSDGEGFYLPIEFDTVIVDSKDKKRIPGGFLGSSYKLRSELISIAPQLGIKLEEEELTTTEAKRIAQEAKSQEGFWIEKEVWLSLFEASQLSIKYKTAICFC